jgi:hypothetical protein
MKEFRVDDESTEPDSHENHDPKGSSIASVASREPMMKRIRAKAKRYLLFGTHDP